MIVKKNTEKNDDILKAAFSSFTEHGYGASSMDKIARKAGVSKQTIYSHFDNKESLFCAVIGSMCPMNHDDATPEQCYTLAPEEFLTKFGTCLLGAITQPEALNLFRTIIAEAPRFPELSKNFYESGPAKGEACIAEYLNIQVKEGTLFIDDIATATRQFIDMIKGTFHLKPLLGLTPPPTEKQIEKHVEQVVKSFLKIYGK